MDKLAIVADAQNYLNGKGGWNNDWEIDLVANLLYVLQNERVSIELDKVNLERGNECNLHSAQCL